MAELYSNQYNTAYVQEPKGKIEPKELNGRIRRIFADVTLGAEITTADQLKLAQLPANAVPIECRIVAPGGTAGTLDLGWAASEEGGEAADPNGLIAGINAAAAVDATLAFSDAGFNKKFSEPVDIELSASVNTAGWSGDLVQFELRYVID